MNKDTQKNEQSTHKIGVELPELLSDRKYYQALVGNRWNNFRYELFDMCNAVLKPIVDNNTWKGRFLNPEKYIPQDNREFIIRVMEENLAFMLQKQYDFLIDKINFRESEIEKSYDDINKLKETLELSKKAVEIYKSKCHE